MINKSSFHRAPKQNVIYIQPPKQSLIFWHLKRKKLFTLCLSKQNLTFQNKSSCYSLYDGYKFCAKATFMLSELPII